MKNLFIIGDNDALISELKNFLSSKYQFSASPTDADITIEVTNYDKELKFNNLKYLEDNISDDTLIISSSLCIPLTAQLRGVKNFNRLFGAGLYPTFSQVKGIECTKTNLSSQDYINSINDLFENTIWVEDRAGMINLRIVSLIINEAYLVLQEHTANENDIDTAMKLGTNYPFGPIEWSQRIGLDVVYNILQSMYNEYGDDRYRITPLLRERYLEWTITNK
ncbi:MAG TPA: 3-hydroxyacyl-CoA dehydrogenase family protein [Ignavibacteria bacterium]|nr:3-hydroxyacyl-CoA dehydrogenase family protein [Ignavibacteria bacterium]